MHCWKPLRCSPQTILLCALQQEAELAAQQGLLQQALAERDQARQALAAAQREVGLGQSSGSGLW